MPVHDSWSDSASVIHCNLKKNTIHVSREEKKKERDGRVGGRKTRKSDARCARPPYASSIFAAFWAACSASMRRCYIEDMFSVGGKNRRGKNNVRTSRRTSRRSSFSLAWALFLLSSFFASFRL